ncbi:aminotransferase class III-fold pyridoxal phosphate-dependent enzyme [Paraburkholderia youngii]|uniref:aminotransferase class III-fold pyridoxal phosphate-dependent enzyme n=1 Tax=Paraburkholderia youngii TaxID=2782701 RepID=UPI003D1E2764
MLNPEVTGHLAEWERETRSSIIFRSANGAVAEDINGKMYLDMTSCSGASPLGSNDIVFNARLARAMEQETDILPSPVSLQRLRLVGKISKMFPDTPRVFFLRTGSCATEAAVRIARYRTGRPVLLTAGFHGWHDLFQQPPWSDSPPARDQHIQDFRYDLDLLEQQLVMNRGRVAGIFFTPEPSIFPAALLHEISRLAKLHGALLIVDEVLCGLRYASGGYCQKHGVKADLITLAKGIAQGIGLSAVVGTDEAMTGADTAYLGHTYLRENRAFVAGNLTQEIFEEAGIVARLAESGSVDLLRPILGAAEFYSSLTAGRRSVVTSSSRVSALARLKAAGISRPRIMIAAEDVRQGKPNPEPYQVLLRTLQIAPERCLVFEDSRAGIEAATTAGCDCVGVGPNASGHPDIKGWIEDFREMTFQI